MNINANVNIRNKVLTIGIPFYWKIIFTVLASVSAFFMIHYLQFYNLFLFCLFFVLCIVLLFIGISKTNIEFVNGYKLVVSKWFIIPFYKKYFNPLNSFLDIKKSMAYSGESSALFYDIYLNENRNKILITGYNNYNYSLEIKAILQKFIDVNKM